MTATALNVAELDTSDISCLLGATRSGITAIRTMEEGSLIGPKRFEITIFGRTAPFRSLRWLVGSPPKLLLPREISGRQYSIIRARQ